MKRITVFLAIGLWIFAGHSIPKQLIAQVPVFTDITGSSGTAGGFPNGDGTAFGDVNNDGHVDLYVATTNGSDRLFLNNGNMTFSNLLSYSGKNYNVSYGDYNNDGLIDILLAAGTGITYRGALLKNMGNDTFQDVFSEALPIAELRQCATWGDLNKDGWVDILAYNDILLNNGDYTFSDITLSTNITATGNHYIVDTDNDGDLDIFILHPWHYLKLYINNGNLTFDDVTSSSGLPLGSNAYKDADFGDIDNDGDFDIYISLQAKNYFFRNDGDNHFTDFSDLSGATNVGTNPSAGRGTRSAGFGDINNDGFLDLYVSNYKQASYMFLNNGDYTFTDVTSVTGTGNGGAGHGIAFGDINNDGHLDLYVANSEGSNRLYLNGGTQNNWIQIKLIGIASNYAAIGAKVIVEAGDLKITREVGRGASDGCQNNIPVHFGIGNASIVEKIEIEWPSDTIQKLTNVTVNQILIVEEVTNKDPVADAGGSYTGYSGEEGASIQFDGVSSFDSDGFIISYKWDLDGDGVYDDATGPIASKTWSDDYTGIIGLKVTDNHQATDTDETTVTVQNVTPTANIDNIEQPNPHFKLPGEVLTFTGNFTDPGYLDSHTSSWDFGDGPNEPGALTEENEPPDATGQVIVTHSYQNSGIFNVTLTIKDDDEGGGTDQMEIEVLSGAQAIYVIDDYIQNLDGDAFNKNPVQKKSVFSKKLGEVTQKINEENYQEAIDKLTNDLRAKMDGFFGGHPKNDWIIDPDAQEVLLTQIDALIEYLQSLLDELTKPFVSKFDRELPNHFRLFQNHPNPFNPETRISYTIPEQTNVTLKIYNIAGEKVVTLVDTQMNTGHHSVNWNGRDSLGRLVSGGIYLCRIQAGTSTQTIRMLLMK